MLIHTHTLARTRPNRSKDTCVPNEAVEQTLVTFYWLGNTCSSLDLPPSVLPLSKTIPAPPMANPYLNRNLATSSPDDTLHILTRPECDASSFQLAKPVKTAPPARGPSARNRAALACRHGPPRPRSAAGNPARCACAKTDSVPSSSWARPARARQLPGHTRTPAATATLAASGVSIRTPCWTHIKCG